MSPESWQRRLPGLELLWRQTRGERSITIAVLDGAADLSHPCFAGADVRGVESVVPPHPVSGHGTGVASILFGQPASGFAGLAPGCRGLIIPVFPATEQGELALTACSQVDLARAIGLALKNGADVINVSGGQLDAGGEASPILAKAIKDCAEQGVLVVAAAGNEGCDCLHVPAAAPLVLVVGAMDEEGTPMATSNWGETYRSQGILAPGQGIPVARPGGGAVSLTGTSFATAIVSGIAALLLSLQCRQGRSPDVDVVRAALLGTARGCDVEPIADCRRLLAGRLDVASALASIRATVGVASAQIVIPAVNDQSRVEAAGIEAEAGEAAEPAVTAAGGSTGPAPVYALGQLGYDFGTEARRDWFLQHGLTNAHDAQALLAYLAQNPAHATSLTFTLLHDATPIYAVVPRGPFAAEAYGRLRALMAEQISTGVDRIAIPGWVDGTVKLINGQKVPVISPELRGTYGWSTAALVKAVAGDLPDPEKVADISSFLERVDDEIRNLGLTSQERAMSYAATNALQLGNVYTSALEDGMKLDAIGVERSPICRPKSDCWDVELTFFHPKKRLGQARVVYRLTIDVSDVVPVTVGPVRHWHVY